MPPVIPASFQRFGATDADAVRDLLSLGSAMQLSFTPVAASGALPVRPSAAYLITKTGAPAVLTLAAPTPGADDGVHLQIISGTNFAHTVTATGLFQGGTAAVNLGTFAAFAGACLDLVAYNGKWIVMDANAVVLS